jgi:hypothetical protein
LVLGERADGSLAHISEVPSGLACHCRCPQCGAPLIARKGELIGHHFGHHGAAGERACQGGPETALHRFAKELLASRLALVLPPLQPDRTGPIHYPGGLYRFDGAALEHRLGTIIPDVIVHRGGRDLLVEFCVTHPCDPDKITKIAALGIAAVEIHLSGLARSASRQELEEAILNQAPRRWLHNPKLLQLPGSSEPTTSRAASRPPRSTAALERAYVAACREVQGRRSASLARRRIEADGLSQAIGLEVAGLGCFNVPPHDWQAVILMHGVERALASGSGLVNAKVALQQIRERGWLRTRFSRLSTAEVAALSAALPSFASPGAAIAAWAMALSRQGLMVPSSARDQWFIRRETLQRVREARRHGVPASGNAP